MNLILLMAVLYLGTFAGDRVKYEPAMGSDKAQVIIIKLKKCTNKTFTSRRITICMDSVLQDSRCPKGAQCIWAGTAVASFSLIYKNRSYPFTLATAPYSRYPSDTLLRGYKIKFMDLTPYPGTFRNTSPAKDIKAELQISKQ